MFCTSPNAVQNEKSVFYFKFSLTETTFKPALDTDGSRRVNPVGF